MVFDTDVLVWVLRGNVRAARAVTRDADRCLSIVTYMELLQGARDRRELKSIRASITAMQFRMLLLTEDISNRAAGYMEQFAPSFALSMPDALIAATVVANGQSLVTGNFKHFRAVRDLKVVRFKP